VQRANGFYTQRTLDAVRKLMTERLTMLVNEANTKGKRDEGEGEPEEEEEELPLASAPTSSSAGQPPVPLAAHAQRVGASMSMLERMLRAGMGGREGGRGDDEEEDDVEPFEILDDEGSAVREARPTGFYSRLLMQDEEPIEYPDEESEDEEEEESEDDDNGSWA
jgi:hypothetical protein